MTRSLVLSTLVAAAFSLVLSTSDAEAGRRHRRCCGGRNWSYSNCCGGGYQTSFASCNTGYGTTYGHHSGYTYGSACGAGGCAPTYSGSGPVPMQNNYAPAANGNAAPPPPAEPAPPQPGT